MDGWNDSLKTRYFYSSKVPNLQNGNLPFLLNDTYMEELVLYWIEYKNSLKYKIGFFWRFSYAFHNQLSSFNSIIVQMSKKRDSSNRQ